MIAEIGVDGWIAIISAIGLQICSLAAILVSARRTSRIHKDIKPPSNSVSLGALVEAIGQIQHLQFAMSHPDKEIPIAQQVGRRLQAMADAGGAGVGKPLEAHDVPPVL